MNGKTHAGISALAYITCCNKFSWSFSYTGVVLVVFAALLPDIDHPKSIFNKYLFFVRNKVTMIIFYACLGLITLWIDYGYFNFTSIELKTLSVSFITVALSSHRNGLTHSLTGLIIFTTLLNSALEVYGKTQLTYIFMLGYGSHILCDMFTNRGVPLFYPFSKKKFKFLITYRVGSKIGNLFEKLILVLGLVYTFCTLPYILKI